jgi:hypothetical protein
VKQTGDPVDLTGLKVRAQIRTVAGEFGTTTSTTLLLDLPNGSGISISDPTDGKITLTLTTAQTIALCPANVVTKVSYGIELYDDGVSPNIVTPFLQGFIKLRPEVVR